MARYTGPVCRLCRREGEKLFLKGQRCFSEKCAIQKRPTIPGQHGQRRSKTSDFGLQLREKQKVKRTYGMLEKQFKHYFERAERQRGVTGENLLLQLERRLDNVVYRSGFAVSRQQARQLVAHGHFRLNNRKATIPSMLVNAGDRLEVKETSKSLHPIKYAVETGLEIPTWIEVDREKLIATIRTLPSRQDIAMPIKEQLIVELYSK